MSVTIQTDKITKSDWYYMKIEIFPDPRINEAQDPSEKLKYDSLSIDLITWKSIILTSMKKLHGLIGESLPFDIIRQIDQKKILIRVYKEDYEKFVTSFMGWTFNLNRYYPIDLNCSVHVIDSNEFIGLIV